MGQWWTIFVAAVGFGAAGEGIRRYRAWKHRRRELSVAQREAGFWTDSRVYHAEAILCAAAAAIPFPFIVSALTIDRGIEIGYLAMLAYALLTYLLIRGLNVGPVQ